MMIASALEPRHAATPRATSDGPDISNASLGELQQALVDGRTTATALTKAYLRRIEAYDRSGPSLNSVREINPDALAIARRRDGGTPTARHPLAGIPILVKDNMPPATASTRQRALSRSQVRAPERTRPLSSGCAPPAR